MSDKIQKTETALSQSTPMDLIALASAQNADIEMLERLWEMQMRYEKNEAMKAFNEAISAFRAECPVIVRTQSAYSSKYAGLAQTIEQIKPLLSKYGLSHRWTTLQNGGEISVCCSIAHKLGHTESTTLTAKPDTSGNKNSIQAIGSTVSYLERYTLFALLGLASKQQDDDGNAACKERNQDHYISDEQAATIQALISEIGANEKKFLSWMGCECIEDIKKVEYKRAVAALEKRRENQ